MIKFSCLRTLLVTLLFGLVLTHVHSAVFNYSDEVPVNLPEVECEAPIIIRVCPEMTSEDGKHVTTKKGFIENGGVYFSNEEAMDCLPGGGSASDHENLP